MRRYWHKTVSDELKPLIITNPDTDIPYMYNGKKWVQQERGSRVLYLDESTGITWEYTHKKWRQVKDKVIEANNLPDDLFTL